MFEAQVRIISLEVIATGRMLEKGAFRHV